MLDRLEASHPDRGGSGTWVSGIVAVLMHGGLVTTAVVATLPTARPTAPHIIPLGDVPYYVPKAGTAPGTRPSGPAITWAAPNLDDLRLPTPDAGTLPPLPGVGDAVMPPATRSGWGSGGAGPMGPGSGGAGPPTGMIYRSLAVDESPILLTRPVLEYPPLLRGAGIEGLVVLEVVVDSVGVPEPGSLHVIEASHPGFVAAATRVVMGARFRPGRMQGRAVRVLIRQPIAFRLAR